MSADETPGQQVALDGSEATRRVPVDRGVLHHSRAIAQFAMEFAANAENGPAVEDLAKHINACTEALEREDIAAEQLAEFGGTDE